MAHEGPNSSKEKKAQIFDDDLDFFGFEVENDDGTPALLKRPVALRVVTPSSSPSPKPKKVAALKQSAGKQPSLQSAGSFVPTPPSASIAIAAKPSFVEPEVEDEDNRVSIAENAGITSMYDLLRTQAAQPTEEEFCVGSVPGSHRWRRHGFEVAPTKPKTPQGGKK